MATGREDLKAAREEVDNLHAGLRYVQTEVARMQVAQTDGLQNVQDGLKIVREEVSVLSKHLNPVQNVLLTRGL